jgi:RNA polymerase sigma-70 factor (ECF subfamily)
MAQPPSAIGRDPRLSGAPAGTVAAGIPGADVGRLREDLVRAVSRACPRWLADRADDLVQNALMRVLDVRARREEEPEFSALYLRKAAYSAVIDEIRRLRRRGEVPLDQDGVVEPSVEAPDPERRAAASELGREIRACLTGLLAARRRAVTLHLLGHPVPEVARLLAIRAKQAENLVYRGLADLRRCLEAKGVKR